MQYLPRSMEKPCNSWVLVLKCVCIGSRGAGKGKWALVNQGKKNRELRFLEAAKSFIPAEAERRSPAVLG